ncbi:TauD/TfdA family dioxygenase [Micromonospora sp. NPDC005806]|uniref:TauD/TfdA family dioxygenase n=1 Tax=Micromonospora sp. NPDC005806 TaxID=3364234 RepID=UPI0036C2812F
MRDVDDLPHVDLRDPDSTARILSGLTTHGITLFQGGAERNDLLCAARSLIRIRTHRDSDSDGVTPIAQRAASNGGKTSLTGFTDRELWPHTEGAAVCRPPRVLMLACLRPAQTGGRSHLVDGRDLYDGIARTEPAMLAALSKPRSAYFGGGSGNLGAIFEQTTEGRITLRLRLDELARFAPMLMPSIDRLRTLVQQQAIPVDLREGHGYILLNDRWLHGRTRFTGNRLMLRIIGDPLSTHALPSGFSPAEAPQPAPRAHRTSVDTTPLPRPPSAGGTAAPAQRWTDSTMPTPAS